ncbi:MAG TPA: CBS domain-containing protein [Pseudomonadales bacterium]
MPISKLPTVRDYMDTETHVLSADDDILVAVRRLIDEEVTDAPVLDDRGRLAGMLSEYDCLQLLTKGRGGEHPRGLVREFMSENVTTVPPTMDLYFVAGMFLAEPTQRRFIVMEGEQLVGVLTRKDVLRAVRAGLPES